MTDPRERLRELHIDRDAAPVRSRRPLLLGISVALVVASALAGWWVTRPALATVRTAPVEAGPTGASGPAGVLDASGYVTARLQATISSKVTGKIAEVLVEEGQQVRRDDVLARLDAATARRQVDVAEAQLESAHAALAETDVRLGEAETNLRRTRTLVAANARSESQLDTDQATVDALRARLAAGRRELAVAERTLALRRQELEDQIIRAPFDGVVVSKDAQPGEMISPVSAGGGFTRTGICTLVDMSSLEIEVDVNEAYINRVTPGQRVRAVLDAYPDWQIPAAVITAVPTADRQKATVRVRIGFDELDPRILPDMGIKVTFLGSETPDVGTGPRGALIPGAAVRREGERSIAFVFADGRVERRALRLGSRSGDRVEVLAGLRVGERVVVDGPADLADGDRVEAR